MINRILTLAVLGAAVISNTGCSNDSGFKKVHGIEYKILKDAPGPTAKMGDIIELNLVAKVDTLVLFDSHRQQGGNPPVPMIRKVDSVRMAGQFEAIFPYLSVGDSAIEYISCDTIIKTIPADKRDMVLQQSPWMKKGKKITVTMSVVSIKSMDDYRKEQQAEQAKMMEDMKAKEAAQAPIDDKALQDYFAKNNVKAQKTASGLYYVVSKTGAGAQITAGQMVSMMYTGKTLDGKAFDSNVDTTIGHHGTAPLSFAVGAHQMIPGVDEAAALLKKGAKATLYLPSQLGYGSRGNGSIPPNAILVFDIEITDVKAAPAHPAAPPAQ